MFRRGDRTGRDDAAKDQGVFHRELNDEQVRECKGGTGAGPNFAQQELAETFDAENDFVKVLGVLESSGPGISHPISKVTSSFGPQ